MARSEKPALRLSEVRRLSSVEGWEDQQIAEYFGIKAIDITRIRSQHNIKKKRVYQQRYVLIEDEEEAQSPGESVMAETVEQEVAPMEEQTVEAVTEETITEEPVQEVVTETTQEGTIPTSLGW